MDTLQRRVMEAFMKTGPHAMEALLLEMAARIEATEDRINNAARFGTELMGKFPTEFGNMLSMTGYVWNGQNIVPKESEYPGMYKNKDGFWVVKDEENKPQPVSEIDQLLGREPFAGQAAQQ